MDFGTLKELNVKPGDVVCVASTWHGAYIQNGATWTVHRVDGDDYFGMKPTYPSGHTGTPLCSGTGFRIISRADAKPKTWGEMTDDEKGALLLAWHYMKVIELFQDGQWLQTNFPGWLNGYAYRIRPEPVRTRVDLTSDGVRVGSVDMVDGKPDPASVEWV
jgi:hypothetical protein